MSGPKQVVLDKDEMKVVTRETLYEVFRKWSGCEEPCEWPADVTPDEKAFASMEYLWGEL